MFSDWQGVKGLTSESDSTATLDRPARWEQRSASRVLEISNRRLLERSHQIVEAAYELLEEEGLEGLTIRAVLKRTGLSRRAFYERFAGKDDLVLAVFEYTLRLAARRFAEQVATLDDPFARLELIVTWIVLGRGGAEPAGERGRGNHRGAALSREHLRLAESRPADLQAALSPLLALIEEELARGMTAGVIRQGDPRRLAALLFNLVSTTVHTELLTEQGAERAREDLAELAGDIWEFCRRAIAA
jgi:AcrR family transcriptional regulator